MNKGKKLCRSCRKLYEKKDIRYVRGTGILCKKCKNELDQIKNRSSKIIEPKISDFYMEEIYAF